MQTLLKKVAGKFLVPLTKWYLRKERSYTFKGINIIIYPGVFHPGLFSSTLFLLDYLETKDLTNQTLLELGCGSGLISIHCAKKGARVTSSDLSIKAVEAVTHNGELNLASLEIIHSDLFESINNGAFDWIIINPPYYAKEPKSEQDLAWNCGANFEYFKKLFDQLPNYILSTSNVIMVLTKGCDQEAIFSIGEKAGFKFTLINEKDVFFDEKDYLYSITFNSFS